MKRSLKNLSVILFICLAITSCKSKNNIASLIPSDALVVTYFDTKSFLDKLPYDSIKATQLFKDIAADSSLSESGKKILNDPALSGIDLDNGMALFVNKGAGDDYNVAFSGFITDESDFESFNKSLDSGAAVSKSKNINTLVIRNTVVAGWNKDRFVYVLNVSNPQKRFEDMGAGHVKFPEENPDHTTSAKTFINELFSLSASASLANESRFNALVKENGDMKVWINPEKMLQTSSMGALGMLKLDAVVKDSRTSCAISFDDGKITAIQKSYYNREMTDLIKKYTGDKVKPEDFAAIPSSDILAAFRANFKPEGIMAFLKLAGLDGFANMFAGDLKISPDELINSLDGTITGSLSDLKINPFTNRRVAKPDAAILDPQAPLSMPPDNSGTFGSGVDFNALLSIGVQNKAAIQKLINGLSDAFMDGNMADDKLPFTLSDKAFVISNKKSFANKYLEDHTGAHPQWAEKISGHPFGFYLSINKILHSVPASKDSAANESLALSLNFWKDVFATGGDFSGDAFTIDSEVDLADPQRNSLRQLNTYIDGLYSINKQKIKDLERKGMGRNITKDSSDQNQTTDPATTIEK